MFEKYLLTDDWFLSLGSRLKEKEKEFLVFSLCVCVSNK